MCVLVLARYLKNLQTKRMFHFDYNNQQQIYLNKVFLVLAYAEAVVHSYPAK